MIWKAPRGRSLVLGAGREAALHLDPGQFALQHFNERGFFHLLA